MARQDPPKTAAPAEKKFRRNERSRADDMVADLLAGIRDSHKGEPAWELRSIAERMVNIDGEPHASVAHWLELLNSETVPSKKTKGWVNTLIKAPLDVEGRASGRAGKSGSITVTKLRAYCTAINRNMCRVLEDAGVCEPALTTRDAIQGERLLTETGKQQLLHHFEILINDPATGRQPPAKKS